MSSASPELESVRTLIWDLDGTLVDSVADLAASVNHVLSEIDASPLAEDEIRAMIGNGVGKLLDRAVAASSVAGQAPDSDWLYQRFSKHYAVNCCNLTKTYEGVEEALGELSRRGYRHGICTNKPEAMARTVVDTLGLSAHFGAIVGGDTTSRHKPDPLPLIFCMEQMQTEPSQTLMIGDSAADVAVARNAGVPVYVLPYGYTTVPAAVLGADAVIDSARRLLALLPGC